MAQDRDSWGHNQFGAALDYVRNYWRSKRFVNCP